MAYKQTPGRGNNPKTGHGLPTPLKQIDPKTNKPEVVTKASNKIHKELNIDPIGKGNQFQTTYDDKGGFKGKATNISNVTSGDYIHRVQGGKTIASVSKSNKKAAGEFVKETEKQVSDQGFRRDKTAGFLNKRKASAVVN